ncbi:MAG: ABC transporter substrate-binding protein [Treponema sp.]|jgi:iron complex transport system substrate-binding protein|nr:ABC transporter substrate-binding protein [Treponema sp.]
MIQKKYLRFAGCLLLGLAGIFCLACSGASTGGGAEPAPGVYSRIISTTPSNTEILVALGFGKNIVAADRYSGEISGIDANLPLIDFFFPDAEFIISLKPDLIITGEINNQGADSSPLRLLEDAGITLLAIPTSGSIDDIYNDINLIAKTLGAQKKGEEAVNGIKSEIAGIVQKNTAITKKKRVYFEIEPLPSMISFGNDTYLNELIELSGGENIFAGQKGWFAPSAEEIIRRNPDVILTMDNGAQNEALVLDEIKKRPGFQTISAVKQNAIYLINADFAARPSPGIVKGLRQIAKAIYPDVYQY